MIVLFSGLAIWINNHFYELLNELNPSIKFTIEINDNKLPFLGVLVIKEGTKITTDVYYKPTDTHQDLHFRS
jgi:hypothetical protein